MSHHCHGEVGSGKDCTQNHRTGGGVSLIRQLTADILIKYYCQVLCNTSCEVKMAVVSASDTLETAVIVQKPIHWLLVHEGQTERGCTGSSLRERCFHLVAHWKRQDRCYCRPSQSLRLPPSRREAFHGTIHLSLDPPDD